MDLSDLLLTCHPLHRPFPIPLFFKRFPLPSFRLPFPFLPINNCRTHTNTISLFPLLFLLLLQCIFGAPISGNCSGKSGIRARSRVRYSRRVEISKETCVGLNSKTQSSVGTLGFLRRLFICFCFSFYPSFRRHKKDLSLIYRKSLPFKAVFGSYRLAAPTIYLLPVFMAAHSQKQQQLSRKRNPTTSLLKRACQFDLIFLVSIVYVFLNFLNDWFNTAIIGLLFCLFYTAHFLSFYFMFNNCSDLRAFFLLQIYLFILRFSLLFFIYFKKILMNSY